MLVENVIVVDLESQNMTSFISRDFSHEILLSSFLYKVVDANIPLCT